MRVKCFSGKETSAVTQVSRINGETVLRWAIRYQFLENEKRTDKNGQVFPPVFVSSFC